MRFRIKNRLRRAFTLIEILIVVVILGILAAIVIPQFTDASEQANDASVKSQLQTLRSQIELFRIQDPVNYNLWDPIAAAAGTKWDPLIAADYLQGEPRNPITGSAEIAAVPAIGGGWVWRDKDGAGPSLLFNIYGVNALGAEFDEVNPANNN